MIQIKKENFLKDSIDYEDYTENVVKNEKNTGCCCQNGKGCCKNNKKSK
ncbi:MAG: hypothetical protein ACRC7N_13035 [Clostridium sp.]